MAEPRPSRILPILLIVVVIVASGVGGGLLYEYNHPKSAAPAWTVALGDNVTVNYIGAFGSGPETGRVFDTSLYTVAVNNASYPKSLGFSYRGSQAAYTPLGVSVGPDIPSSGYTIDGITFGGVVTGFWQGLLGMPLGRAESITVPPDLGYGPIDPSCLVSQPLTFTVPAVVSVSTASFAAAYPNVTALPGTQFTDPTYGWTDLILSTNASSVVVENLPPLGWSVPSSSWPLVVMNLSASAITLTNQLTPADAGLVLGHVSGSGVCGATKYIVSAVNLVTGTYTENFNSEVTGQTLIFTVTVVAHY